MPTVVILGGSGQMGIALSRIPWATRLPVREPAHVVTLEHQRFDITRDDHRRSLLDDRKPSVVINAAAYTNVEGAEDEPDLCREVNVRAPAELARLCAERGCRFVHLSTDYVFDGDQRTPYTEDDPTGGLSVYGRSKAEGDAAVLGADGSPLVVRSSWLFGEGRNFVRTILRLAGERDRLQVVADQVGCPTRAEDFADAVARLLAIGAQGLYHFSNDGACSWFDFALEAVRLANLPTTIEPVPAASMTIFKAPRPHYSVLDCSKYIAATGHRPRHWKAALRDYLDADPENRNAASIGA